MGLQEAYRGRSIYPSCHRESQSRVSVVMMVVSENELKRKLSVGPGLIVDKTTLVHLRTVIIWIVEHIARPFSTSEQVVVSPAFSLML